MSLKYFLKFFSLLPKNCLSFITGWFVRISFPDPLQRGLNKLFVWCFGIDMSEAKNPLHSFQSIEDVFTRQIKMEFRPMLGDYVSPSDGLLARSHEILNPGEGIQAKGITYSIEKFLGMVPVHEINWQTVVYLAPHNYHRVHSPLQGELLSITYIPGDLWPVNAFFVEKVPAVFASNERLVFHLRKGDGNLYLVMVGAFNVGRMTTPFWPDFHSNPWNQVRGPIQNIFSLKRSIAKGEELGTFMLGSTVVLLSDQAFQTNLSSPFRSATEISPIKLGEDLLVRL